MEFNIEMDSIHDMMKNDCIQSGDFAQIAIEESSEMIQAITKIKRGKCTITDKDNLIEEMADNILATLYLMESLGFTEEVSDMLTQKHKRNYKNAECQNFIKREKCRTFETVHTLLLNSIKLARGQKPIIATILDDNYCMVVEMHVTYGLIYLQKYDKSYNEPELEDLLYGEKICSESFFMDKDFEYTFKKKVKSVYENYKQAIIF